MLGLFTLIMESYVFSPEGFNILSIAFLPFLELPNQFVSIGIIGLSQLVDLVILFLQFGPKFDELIVEDYMFCL